MFDPSLVAAHVRPKVFDPSLAAAIRSTSTTTATSEAVQGPWVPLWSGGHNIHQVLWGGNDQDVSLMKPFDAKI